MLLRGPYSCAAASRPAGLSSHTAAAVRALARAKPASLPAARPFRLARPALLCAAAISKPTDAAAASAAPVISIDNGTDASATVVRVAGANRPGLLTALTAAFRDLGLDVKKVRKEERMFFFLFAFPPSKRRASPSLSSFFVSTFPPFVNSPPIKLQAEVRSPDGAVDNTFYIALVRI